MILAQWAAWASLVAALAHAHGPEVQGDCGWLDLTGAQWAAVSSNGSLRVPAVVPGQIHLDLLRAGVIKVYFSF